MFAESLMSIFLSPAAACADFTRSAAKRSVSTAFSVQDSAGDAAVIIRASGGSTISTMTTEKIPHVSEARKQM